MADKGCMRTGPAAKEAGRPSGAPEHGGLSVAVQAGGFPCLGPRQKALRRAAVREGSQQGLNSVLRTASTLKPAQSGLYQVPAPVSNTVMQKKVAMTI